MRILKKITTFCESLRGRLIISIAIVQAILMSLFIIDLTFREKTIILNHQSEESVAIAKALSLTASSWISSNDLAGLQEIVDVQAQYPEHVYTIITDEFGYIKAHSDKSKVGLILDDLPKDPEQVFINNNNELIDIIAPSQLSGKHVGWVRIGLGQKKIYQQLNAIRNNGFIYGFVAISFGSIIVLILGNFVTKRLYTIQETINEVAKGNTTARSNLKGQDEAALLAKEFNKMLDTKERFEKKLRENYKKLKDYQFALNQSTITSITNKKGIILAANDNFCSISKYKREELIGESHSIINSNFHSKTFFKEMWKTIKSGKVWHGEIKNKTKDGEYYWVHSTIIPFLDPNKKPIQYLAIYFDITAKKKAEEEIVKAKEQAEESDRLKSAFLANMSHEIRTPMNGILGFAELLKNPDISGKDQREYINIIEKSGARMLGIINDIIDLSKIESGLMKIALSETNINKQIEYIYTFFKPEANKKKLSVSYSTSLSDDEATVDIDREKIYAILFNLVKNAIKYTHKGTIDLGYSLKPTIKKQGSFELEFFVKDTGIGIPKNKHKEVFDRFIQANISDKSAIQGAGLGLSISKAYVEMLGGTIWVESEEEEGTTFYFTIPYSKSPKKETPVIKQKTESAEEHKLVKDLKILIVEDDAISKLLISKIISPYAKTILKASTGIEAVDACRDNPDIDLVLMDINMPEMSGLEATKIIREFNREIIIIAQTAHGLSSDKEKTLEVGCNDYISKPIDISKLKVLIQKYFSE